MHIRNIAIAASCAAMLLASTRPVGAGADDPGRVTTRFELAQVKPLMQRIARLCTAGFTRDEAQRLVTEIDALRIETARTWEFSATCKGQLRQLRIRALVDELSGVDLDFSTDPELAAQIRQVVGSSEKNKP